MNWKRIFALAAITLGILAVIGIGVGRLFLDFWPRFEPIPEPLSPAFVDAIGAKGFTPEVTANVRSLTLPATSCFVWVAEAGGDHRVVAAAPREWEGRTQEELLGALRTEGRRCQAEWEPVTAPDGKQYTVGDAHTDPVLPGRFGGPFFLAGVLAGALAWLALAAWIYRDARDRGSATATGWGLLGVLAAPLALAVWLISGRGQPQAAGPNPIPVCPGCGADVPEQAAFCVRCGFALRPSCPACRHLVEPDWSYCAACGRDLSEPS